MSDVLLSTTGTVGTVVLPDLGDATFIHPVVNINLTEEFDLDDINDSIAVGGDLSAALVAGEITLTDGFGNPITSGGMSTEFVSLNGDETISGVKTFSDTIVTNDIDAPPGFNLLLNSTDTNITITSTESATGDDALLFLDGVSLTMFVGTLAAGNNCGFLCTAGSINTLIPAGADFQLNSTPGAIRQVFMSQGVGNPPIFDFVQFDDLGDVDLTTIPPNTGSSLYFDGTNWVPTVRADDQIYYFQNGCSAEFIDALGLDFCVTEIGTGGSAFYVAKKALGTIATPLPVTAGTKVGGYSFVAVDGVTTNPGFVGCQAAAYAVGDQDAVNGGMRYLIETTPQGTKSAQTVFQLLDSGDVVFDLYPNTRDDGASATAFYPNATGTIQHGKIFAIEGYVETNNGTDNAINYNQTVPTKIQFSGTNYSNNPDLVWNAANNSWDVNFTGQVKVQCMLNTTSAGVRNHISPQIARDRGGTITSKFARATYLRNTTGHNRDSMIGQHYFDCQPGDQFFIRAIRDGNNASATNLYNFSNFSIKQIGE